MIKRAILIFMLFVPSAGWAQVRSALISGQKGLERLENHHNKLELLLSGHSQRIIRLKSQQASVRRDFQLKAALRDSQALASKLTQLRTQIREKTQQQILSYQRIISATTDFSARKALKRQLKLLKQKLAGSRTRILTGGKINPLDSPEDLIEKADLLEDSEEKLQRRIRQVEVKIASLEHRVKLKRHGKALDDNPFNEASPRRTGQVRRTTLTSAAPQSVPEDPAPPPAPSSKVDVDTEGGGKWNTPAAENPDGVHTNDDFSAAPPTADIRRDAPDPSATPGSLDPTPGVPAREISEGVIVSIQDVMDPTLLMELTGPDRANQKLPDRLAALKRARQQLHHVANRLNQQARQLRSQAKSLRLKK